MASSFSFKRRPSMLKDFLIDELPSSSSNDLKSYPRKPCNLRARSLSKPNTTSSQLLRSGSKAASISISVVHKASVIVINAIKFFPFATMKTPTILPRSISRKLSRRNKEDRNRVVLDDQSVKVKIKDILRWKSFRDVVMELEEMPIPLEYSCSQDHSTTTTITTGSSSTDSSSKRSSWCGCDFTAEDSSSCCSEDKDCMNESGAERFGKNYLQDCLEATTTGTASKRELRFDEDDQHSPVSVLHSPFREDEEFFHRSLATVERRKCRLMQRIQEFESLTTLEPVKNLEKDQFPTEENQYSNIFEEEEEETNKAMDKKANQLLSHVKRRRSGKHVEAANSDHDHLLLDFFRHELAIGSTEQNDGEFDSEMLRLAESWLSEECNGSFDLEMLGKRKDCVKDMEKGVRWNSFEEAQQELGCKFEIEVLNDLIHEILADLCQ